VAGEFGAWKKGGKLWQYCRECGTSEWDAPLMMIIGKADYRKYVVSRGTSEQDPWKDDCEPLF
jgi:hypothetical protein